MHELTPGVELGARYVLVRRIGRGGTAEVWLAHDRERGGEVALKILDLAIAGDAPRMRSLGEEVAHVRSLPPEFVVAVRDFGQAAGRAYLAMEYCDGGDLGQFRGRSFEAWSRALDEVAAALEALHARGLVHRDLKCGNVLIDGAGRARLADFGLASLAGAFADGGSPYNASPQQLRGEQAAPPDDLYALGALLFELIAGAPPYYPDITRDRVLHEPVPPLVPRGDVPVSVRELALRLLSKSPHARPTTAAEVRRVLAAASGDSPDVLQPIAHELPSGAARAKGRRGLLPAALAAAAALAIVALVWLQPKFLGGESALREAREQAEAQREENRRRAVEAAARAAAQAAAETAREEFLAKFKSLDARAAARWATAEFAAARDAGAAAAKRYEVGDFTAAQKRWQDAAAKLAALEKRAPAALADAMKRAREALAEARTGTAREAFRLALAIDPKHAAASSGLARADRLDQALAIVDRAVAEERAGNVAAAEAGFRKAQALDPATPGAKQGIERIASRRTEEAFAAAMSRGFADLAAGRGDAARDGFRQALALRPSSREARDALATLEQSERGSTLQSLESRARAAEAGENWDQALEAWREAASLEASLVAAREGIARSAPRAELQRRIDALNMKPERLWNPEGRAEARKLLAEAAAAGNPRSRLAQASRELERLVAAAESPVRLRLESDGLTQVAIYRVGQYGAFATREIELLPGRYTVVGTRNGYRDVRREVVLMPGAEATAVVVRCEEPI